MPRKDIIATVMGLYLSTETRENWSIKASQEVLERKYGNEMTQSDQDAFKVAFVIYIMSTLLSPGSKYDCVSGLLGCSCGPIKHRRFRLVRLCNKEAIPGSRQAKRLSFSLATKCQILLDAPFSSR